MTGAHGTKDGIAAGILGDTQLDGASATANLLVPYPAPSYVVLGQVEAPDSTEAA